MKGHWVQEYHFILRNGPSQMAHVIDSLMDTRWLRRWSSYVLNMLLRSRVVGSWSQLKRKSREECENQTCGSHMNSIAGSNRSYFLVYLKLLFIHIPGKQKQLEQFPTYIDFVWGLFSFVLGVVKPFTFRATKASVMSPQQQSWTSVPSGPCFLGLQNGKSLTHFREVLETWTMII